jgi:magnesium-transporting ATPase (P-type)
MQLSKVARLVLTDSIALLLTLLISLASVVVFHVPVAITLVLVLAIELLTQALPLSVLAKYKGSHKPDYHLSHQAIMEVITFGVLAAALAYGNYLLFFARHGLSPAHMDTANPLYAQAITLTYLTLVLCQFMNLLFVRADKRKRFFTKYLWSNQKLLQAGGVSAFILINVIYNHWIQPIFGTGPLDIIDWLAAVAAAGFYTGWRIFQRHTRHHARHAVIKLHREVHNAR